MALQFLFLFLFLHFLLVIAVMMMVMALKDMITGMIMVVKSKFEEIKKDEPITPSITGVIGLVPLVHSSDHGHDAISGGSFPCAS